MSNEQSNNGLTTSSENIVKSILYACVISCMVGPMGEMMTHASCHKFQLTIGFIWFLFYSAYLYDDIRTGLQHDLSSPCLGLELLGWMCFMIQGATIGCSATAIVSIAFGCIGVGFINLSLSKKKDNYELYRKWMAENGIMLILMIALFLGHWLEHGSCKNSWLFNGLFWTWVVLVLFVLLFVSKTRILSFRDIGKILDIFFRSLLDGGKLLLSFCTPSCLKFTEKDCNTH